MWAALLSPAVRALPSWTAAAAGKSAWLTGILAFPVLLGLGWLLSVLLRRGEGLGQALQRSLGPRLGRGAVALCLLWALFLLCLEGRLAAGRILSAGYRAGSPALFLLALLALAAWMGRGKLSAFARAGEICALALSLGLGLVVLVSLLDLEPERVLPVWSSDLPRAGAAALIPVGVVSRGALAAFLAGQVEGQAGDRRRGAVRLLAGCLALALLQLGVLGQLGAGLCARLDAPFFEVARGIGLEGAFQRVDAVISALWILSDFAQLGLLVFALRHMAGALLGPRGERWAPLVCPALALAGGLLLFPDDFAAQALAEGLAPWVDLGLALLLPSLALLAGWIRRRGK